MIEAKKVKEYLDDVLNFTIEEFKARHTADYFLSSCGLNEGGAEMMAKTQVAEPEKLRQKWAVDGEDLVYPLEFPKGCLWIGRGVGCDLLLLEPGVSELQAKLTKNERGLFLIPSEDATNKTYVERKPITEPTIIKDTQVIAFGQHQYTLYSKSGFYLAVGLVGKLRNLLNLRQFFLK